MKRVSLCCNNHRSGVFAGRLRALELPLFGMPFHLECVYGDWSPFLEIRPIDGMGMKFLNISKRRHGVPGGMFRYGTQGHWYGNWCWDVVMMETSEAKRMLRWLARRGWFRPDSGATRAWEWWERQTKKNT